MIRRLVRFRLRALLPDLRYLSDEERIQILWRCDRRLFRPWHYLAVGLLLPCCSWLGVTLALWLAGSITMDRRWLGVAAVLGAVGGISGALFGFCSLLARRLRRGFLAELRDWGRCTSCGYDLRGTPALCPECGAAVAG